MVAVNGRFGLLVNKMNVAWEANLSLRATGMPNDLSVFPVFFLLLEILASCFPQSQIQQVLSSIMGSFIALGLSLVYIILCRLVGFLLLLFRKRAGRSHFLPLFPSISSNNSCLVAADFPGSISNFINALFPAATLVAYSFLKLTRWISTNSSTT